MGARVQTLSSCYSLSYQPTMRILEIKFLYDQLLCAVRAVAYSGG